MEKDTLMLQCLKEKIKINVGFQQNILLFFLDARKADSNEIPDGCDTIFIKNLPYDLTEDELGDKFKPCGDIRSIRFVYNPVQNHFKG